MDAKQTDAEMDSFYVETVGLPPGDNPNKVTQVNIYAKWIYPEGTKIFHSGGRRPIVEATGFQWLKVGRCRRACHHCSKIKFTSNC